MRWGVPDFQIKWTLPEPDWRMMDIIGRGDRIRTYDPLRPRQVRYQAALRPDRN